MKLLIQIGFAIHEWHFHSLFTFPFINLVSPTPIPPYPAIILWMLGNDRFVNYWLRDFRKFEFTHADIHCNTPQVKRLLQLQQFFFFTIRLIVKLSLSTALQSMLCN